MRLASELKLDSDLTLLALVLRKLLENANSYATDNSQIEMDASIANGLATIKVRNSTVNLPRDMADPVFYRFLRADASCVFSFFLTTFSTVPSINTAIRRCGGVPELPPMSTFCLKSTFQI